MQVIDKCFDRVKKDCFKFIKLQETSTEKFSNKEDKVINSRLTVYNGNKIIIFSRQSLSFEF